MDARYVLRRKYDSRVEIEHYRSTNVLRANISLNGNVHN